MKRNVIILVIISLLVSSCSILRKEKKGVVRCKEDTVYVNNREVVLESYTAGDSPEMLEEKVYIAMDRGEGIGLGSVGTIGHGAVSYAPNVVSTNNNISNSNVINVTPQYKKGSIVYSIPDTMKVGKEYRIKLRISSIKSNLLYSGMDIKSVKVDGVRISDNMTASLIDYDNAFNIKMMNNGEQSIEADSSYTEWE